MARKVITLDGIRQYIEDKSNKEQKVIMACSCNGKVFAIADTTAVLLGLNETDDGVHSVITDNEIKDFDADHPFMELKEALKGNLRVDGVIPPEDDLRKYCVTID